MHSTMMFHAPAHFRSPHSGNTVTVSDLIDWSSLTDRQTAIALVALDQLVQSGVLPSVRALRESLGGGSFRDVSRVHQVVRTAVRTWLSYSSHHTAGDHGAESFQHQQCTNRDRVASATLIGSEVALAHGSDATRQAEESATESEAHEPLKLEAEIAELRAQLAAEQERYEGMRRHLLLETARQRDAIAREMLEALRLKGYRIEGLNAGLLGPGQATAMSPLASPATEAEKEEPIYERG